MRVLVAAPRTGGEGEGIASHTQPDSHPDPTRAARVGRWRRRLDTERSTEIHSPRRVDSKGAGPACMMGGGGGGTWKVVGAARPVPVPTIARADIIGVVHRIHTYLPRSDSKSASVQVPTIRPRAWIPYNIGGRYWRARRRGSPGWEGERGRGSWPACMPATRTAKHRYQRRNAHRDMHVLQEGPDLPQAPDASTLSTPTTTSVDSPVPSVAKCGCPS